MSVKKIKAIELVQDWNLWPRHKAEVLDSTNIGQLRDALRAGMRLPPVIVSEDMRIIDGFHRTKAVLDVFGDAGEIEADIRHYDNDAAMFLEAAALNNHGLKLSPLDRAHFILKAQKMKIPPKDIAVALGTNPEKMQLFIEKRSATTSTGEVIALPHGAAHTLAGKILNDKQKHFAETANGCLPGMYARMLLNALRAEALTINASTKQLLTELYQEIAIAIGG